MKAPLTNAGISSESKLKSEAAEKEAASLENMLPEERDLHEARKLINSFRADTEEARKHPYKPGTTYDQLRNDFIKTIKEWDDPELRKEAADALSQSFDKTWGASKNKLKDLKAEVRILRDES